MSGVTPARVAWSSIGLRACVIALAGIVAGAAHSAVKPLLMDLDTSQHTGTTIVLGPRDGIKPVAPDNPGNKPVTDTPSTKELGPEVTVADAKALFDLGTPFLDARREDEYAKGHVAGARRVTSDEFVEKRAELATFAPMPGPVVIYCNGGKCDASHNLAKVMQAGGYTQYHIMVDGYDAWAKAAHPTAAGAQ